MRTLARRYIVYALLYGIVLMAVMPACAESTFLEIGPDAEEKFESETVTYDYIDIYGNEVKGITTVYFYNCSISCYDLKIRIDSYVYLLNTEIKTTYFTIERAYLYLCNQSNSIDSVTGIKNAGGHIFYTWLVWSNVHVILDGARCMSRWLTNGTYQYRIDEPHYAPTTGNVTIAGAGVELSLELIPDWDEDSIPDSEDHDDDNDGYDDIMEEALGSDPKDNASRPADNDGDMLPDATDPDDDNDGWNDTDETGAGSDPFDNSSVPHDLDGDGVPDYRDDDMDGDGWNNTVEQQCGTDSRNNKSQPKDTDKDGVPDILDPDDDNDGYNDPFDKFPQDPLEWNDTDGDGIGDNSDIDIDDDGYINEVDAFPFDPSEWLDTDMDGIGNNKDPDDDGDGFTDLQEEDNGTNPLDALDFPVIIVPEPDGEDNGTGNDTEPDGGDGNNTGPDNGTGEDGADGEDNDTSPNHGDGEDGGELPDGSDDHPDDNESAEKTEGRPSIILWIGILGLLGVGVGATVFIVGSRKRKDEVTDMPPEPERAPRKYDSTVEAEIIEPKEALNVEFDMRRKKPKQPLGPIDL